MLSISTILKHYKRCEIQEAMLASAEDREVAVRYGDKGFGKRPDTLYYPKDVLEFARQGATSFHVSEERWTNVQRLRPELSKQELDGLRRGWDLVIDIDCPDFRLSKIIAWLVITALKEHRIGCITVKFSGNKGFHIGVPFEGFPQVIHDRKTKDWFPEGPRRIAAYLVNYISAKHIAFVNEGISFGGKFRFSAKELAEMTQKRLSQLTKTSCARCNKEIHAGIILNEFVCAACGFSDKSESGFLKCPNCMKLMEKLDSGSLCKCGSSETKKELNAAAIMQVDTLLISSRHLYRMPYSLHEKSGLCSVVIESDKVLKFEREMAEPSNATAKLKFLDSSKAKMNEAAELIIQAFDFSIPQEKEEKPGKEYAALTSAAPQDLFPPCIKGILAGIEDGRKRSLFTLINFLQSVGYDLDAIDKLLHEWNSKNREPLREVLIKGQLRYRKGQKSILPPNCKAPGYYVDIGVCKPDSFCPRIKNPVNYTLLKIRLQERNDKGGRTKLTEEQKEMRRKFREGKA